MRARLERRLLELRDELRSGSEALAQLEAKQAQMRETLLRISGAIQVLEEELGAQEGPTGQARGGTGPKAEAASAQT